MSRQPLYAVDASIFIFRAYFSLPPRLAEKLAEHRPQIKLALQLTRLRDDGLPADLPLPCWQSAAIDREALDAFLDCNGLGALRPRFNQLGGDAA